MPHGRFGIIGKKDYCGQQPSVGICDIGESSWNNSWNGRRVFTGNRNKKMQRFNETFFIEKSIARKASL
jgi:hypothetical protein